MTTQNLVVRDNPARHRFEIDLGDGSVAIAEYTLSADKIIFTHSEVPEGHEGKGIGTTLIRFALNVAREGGEGHTSLPILRCLHAEARRGSGSSKPAWRTKFGLD